MICYDAHYIITWESPVSDINQLIAKQSPRKILRSPSHGHSPGVGQGREIKVPDICQTHVGHGRLWPVVHKLEQKIYPLTYPTRTYLSSRTKWRFRTGIHPVPQLIWTQRRIFIRENLTCVPKGWISDQHVFDFSGLWQLISKSYPNHNKPRLSYSLIKHLVCLSPWINGASGSGSNPNSSGARIRSSPPVFTVFCVRNRSWILGHVGSDTVEGTGRNWKEHGITDVRECSENLDPKAAITLSVINACIRIYVFYTVVTLYNHTYVCYVYCIHYMSYTHTAQRLKQDVRM